MDSTRNPIAPPRLAGYAKPKRDGSVAILLTAMAVVALIVLFLFDPSHNSIYPVCPFHKITGLNCPGCGSTRAFHQLLHGHILEALRCNALVMLTMPFLGWLAIRHLVGNRLGWSMKSFDFPSRGLWIFLTVALFFTVLRNLPLFAWLSP